VAICLAQALDCPMFRDDKLVWRIATPQGLRVIGTAGVFSCCTDRSCRHLAGMGVRL